MQNFSNLVQGKHFQVAYALSDKMKIIDLV